MTPFLKEIFSEGGLTTDNGERITFHSETSKGLCEYLQDIVIENGFRSSIEIGFAYGLSTLAILEVIAAKGGIHVVIDKFENSHWKGSGLSLIDKSGLRDHLEFYEEYCYEVLPLLLSKKRRFDFAYIDSTKQFDWLLVNFFYLDKMLEKGGIIVFDDVNFPGIKKLLRMITSFPTYEVVSHFPSNFPESRMQKAAGYFAKLPMASRFLRPELLKTDKSLGLLARAVAIKKNGEDQRNWDWFQDF